MATADDDQDLRLRELMRAAQAGDRACYDRLLRDLAPIIHAAVRRQRSFLSTEDVEDLVQEALLSVHAVRATYDPDRPFTPWLMAIVRNRVADSGRRYMRMRAIQQASEDFYETFRPDEANTDADSHGDAEGLRRAIARLPKGQRRAIELMKLRDLSLKEASRESGMSVAALKVSVHRGIKALRASFKKHD